MTTLKSSSIIMILLLAISSVKMMALEADSRPTTPDEAKAILAMPDSAKRQVLIDMLKLRSAIFGESCGDVRLSASKIIWQSGPENLTVVEANSYDCAALFVLVFLYSNEHWKYIGTIPLWDKYSIPTYKAEMLFRGSAPGILVSGETVDAGTGIVQKNMQIFAIINDELRVVFDEPETMRVAVPFKQQCCPVVYKDTQESTFKVIPMSGDARSADIAEERRITVNGHSLVERKMYVWDAGLNIFFSVGEAPQLH